MNNTPLAEQHTTQQKHFKKKKKLNIYILNITSGNYILVYLVQHYIALSFIGMELGLYKLLFFLRRLPHLIVYQQL